MITVIDETNNDDSAASKQSPPETDTMNEDRRPAKAAPTALPFPVPSPSIKSAPNSNSDLMSRLQNFLPQMESANQELLSMPVTGTDPLRLDTNLQVDDEDSDSDDEEGSQTSNPLIQVVDKTKEKQTKNEKGSSASKETSANQAAPTIQLEFTLGNMAGNPLMKLLSSDDDGDDGSTSDNGDDNVNDAARQTAISNLLKESQNSSETKNNIVLLDGSNENTNKNSLITELS